ncbi:PREDICTED: leucine-rich repeat-containing protein 69 [Elephantulus edwardii]|uniref:leucine-rich repeat-containing protein 69 n=1 Tax=Elephantulus edwardii TaxID=28737 RepID=UPI0003F0674D|nr:PREDICTED: leucine-rich repeat-containing protein 69 [Elephantulus edwardii]
MSERLLVRALKGGKNTKIVTLNGKKIVKMPSTLGKLSGLNTLALQDNLITKVCPELSALTQLTTLNMGNNLLEEVPEEFKYLTSLKKLHLFGNKIHRFSPEACDGLINLVLLNLNKNLLTCLPPEINRLHSLTHLSINYNQLASVPEELCFLENLRELQLNHNQLTHIPEEIKFLKKLEKLLLIRNSITSLPEGICHLTNLKILDIAGNIIQIFPPLFQNLKLKEFYCDENPLLLKQPVYALELNEVLTLQEITSRFITNQLAEDNPLLKQAIKHYPQAREKISQEKVCPICGKSFLNVWLECVQFVPPLKNCKMSRDVQWIPLRKSVCSYKCFHQRGPDVFGIAQVQSR